MTVTLRRHQEINALKHIEEQLIAPIFDAFPSPSDLTSHLAGDLTRFLFGLKQDDILSKVVLSRNFHYSITG